MKNIAVLAFLGMFLMTGGRTAAAEQTVTLNVFGMTCASCPYIVRESLAAVDGVTSVDVSMLERSAIVTFDEMKSTIADLTSATTNAGFPSEIRASEE
jgi:periplasmic mercuric ion binding protein